MSQDLPQPCWEIMQCGDDDSCPVRAGRLARCWEQAEQRGGFQSHYGLCAECIVFLCHHDNPILSNAEIAEILTLRSLARIGGFKHPCPRRQAA